MRGVQRAPPPAPPPRGRNLRGDDGHAGPEAAAAAASRGFLRGLFVASERLRKSVDFDGRDESEYIRIYLDSRKDANNQNQSNGYIPYHKTNQNGYIPSSLKKLTKIPSRTDSHARTNTRTSSRERKQTRSRAATDRDARTEWRDQRRCLSDVNAIRLGRSRIFYHTETDFCFRVSRGLALFSPLRHLLFPRPREGEKGGHLRK